MSKTVNKKYHILFVRILVGLLCLPVLSVQSQSTGKLAKKAAKAFSQADYYTAARLYAVIVYDSPLVVRSNTPLYPFQPSRKFAKRNIHSAKKLNYLYHLAEAYRLSYHPQEAIHPYEQLFAFPNQPYPTAPLSYGKVLLSADQPAKAITVLQQYLKTHKQKDSLSELAQQTIANATWYLQQKSKPATAKIFRRENLHSADGSNFGYEPLADTSFLFTTSRSETDKKNQPYYPLRIYQGSTITGAINKLPGFTNDLNMGASSLSEDGLSLYFTGWKTDAKNLHPLPRIYVATKISAEMPWQNPVELSTAVNQPGYVSKEPFVTRDKRWLYFVSNRPGGFGNEDIWMIALQDGLPVGEAVHLDSNINTKETEASPYFDSDSSYLYFSSNGRIGMGGMDIYRVKQDSKVAAENLGYPMNSVKDDVYFHKGNQKDTVYFSSDRSSVCCLEIFAGVQIKDTVKTIHRDTILITPEKAKEPIDSALIRQLQEKREMDSVNTATVNRLHVNYRFASSLIRKVDYPILLGLVKQLQENPALNVLVASFTDCFGSKESNLKLARKRAESVRKFLINKGIATDRINLDFFGKQHFVKSCKEDSSYDQRSQLANRRSDLILTEDKHPKWQPSGEEIDIAGAPFVSAYRIKRDSIQTQTLAKTAKQTTEQEKRKLIKKSAADQNNNRPKKESDAVAGKNLISGNPSQNSQENKTLLQHAPDKKKETLIPISSSPKRFMLSKKEKIQLDTMQGRMRIAELLDLTPHLKQPSVIEEMTSRTPIKSFEVYSLSDSVKVELYDNGVFDYDSVSVIYNKQLVVYKQQLLTNKPIRFYVKLDTDPSKNEMIFFAENLGLTPPNSALMIITDGENKRTEINVSSDLKHNAVIYFIKVKR